jgi:hypothetical protein
MKNEKIGSRDAIMFNVVKDAESFNASLNISLKNSKIAQNNATINDPPSKCNDDPRKSIEKFTQEIIQELIRYRVLQGRINARNNGETGQVRTIANSPRNGQVKKLKDFLVEAKQRLSEIDNNTDTCPPQNRNQLRKWLSDAIIDIEKIDDSEAHNPENPTPDFLRPIVPKLLKKAVRAIDVTKKVLRPIGQTVNNTGRVLTPISEAVGEALKPIGDTLKVFEGLTGGSH